jgi:hypothetical protein
MNATLTRAHVRFARPLRGKFPRSPRDDLPWYPPRSRPVPRWRDGSRRPHPARRPTPHAGSRRGLSILPAPPGSSLHRDFWKPSGPGCGFPTRIRILAAQLLESGGFRALLSLWAAEFRIARPWPDPIRRLRGLGRVHVVHWWGRGAGVGLKCRVLVRILRIAAMLVPCRPQGRRVRWTRLGDARVRHARRGWEGPVMLGR